MRFRKAWKTIKAVAETILEGCALLFFLGMVYVCLVTFAKASDETGTISTQSAGFASREDDYSGEDIMCLANMVYHEVSGVCLDGTYSWAEQQTILEQWASVALNHMDRGYADSLPALMRMRTAAGYYVWHPQYATVAYQDDARAEDPERYERCRIAAIAAMNGTGASLPPDVIYADCAIHGRVYRQYTIDTGWYRSTVYLSHVR